MQPHQPEPLLAKRAALRQTHHARRNGPPRRRRAAPPAAGMSLGWGWGADGGGRKQDGAAPQPPPPAGGPPTTGEEESGSSSDEPLPLEVARFIATASGVKWLSDTLKDWPDMLVGAKGRLDQTRDRIQRAPHHLNKFVVREYRKLVRSELGRRIIGGAQSAEAAMADPLAVPLYVVEDVIKMRLLQMIESHWRVLTWRVCTRSSLACGGIHLIKLGVKRLARGRPRVAKAVDYVCDVLLPTGCYGLLLGVSLVAVQSVHELLAAPELPDPQ